MSDILREVDEAMRVEKMTRLWQAHGNKLIAAVVLLILGTALHSGLGAWKHGRNEANTAALLESLRQEDPLPALESLEKAKTGNPKAFASLMAAALAVEKKELDKALSLYAGIVQDGGADLVLRDLATLQKVSVTLDAKPEVAGEALLLELAPLLANTKSPWRSRALLLSALIKAHKGKDAKGAMADLETLSATPFLSPVIREQAAALRQVYLLAEEGAK